MANGCGLCHWGSNSRVIHATAIAPEGPYTRQGIAAGVFSHNPEVVKGPGDTSTLFHISHATKPRIPDCATGDFSGNTTAPNTDPANTGNIHVADHPGGAWTANFSGACNNPAPYRHPNGTWYQLCRMGGGGEQYNASLISTASLAGR